MAHPQGAVAGNRLGKWGSLLADNQRESQDEISSQTVAQEAALGTVPTEVLPAISISESSFRT